MRLQVSAPKSKLSISVIRQISRQVLRIYPPILPSLYRVLHMANCDIYIRSQAIDGNVPVLYTPPANSRRMFLHSPRPPRKLSHTPLCRPIFRRLPGQKLSVELVPFGKRTHSRLYHPIPLPIAQPLLQSLTLMMSPTAFCDKKTTLSLSSTRNYSTYASPSLQSSSASFRPRRERDGCLPRLWSGTYASV